MRIDLHHADRLACDATVGGVGLAPLGNEILKTFFEPCDGCDVRVTDRSASHHGCKWLIANGLWIVVMV